MPGLLIQSQQKSISTSTKTLEVTENMQANGRSGAVQAELNGNITINADVYAVYTYGDGLSLLWLSVPEAIVKLL